jgi:hypothetical protein
VKNGQASGLNTSGLNPYMTIPQLISGVDIRCGSVGLSPMIGVPLDTYARAHEKGSVGLAELLALSGKDLAENLPLARLVAKPKPSKLYPRKNRKSEARVVRRGAVEDGESRRGAPSREETVGGAAASRPGRGKRAARANGITPDIFLKLVKQESGFNARATSPAGAQGLTQLMPATARGLGVTDPYDLQQNLNAGAKYLAAQLKAFGGDYRKALAAYNAGPGAVQKYGGVPPYAETQRYVRNILGGSAPTAAPAVGGGRRFPSSGGRAYGNPGLSPSIAGILNANNAILGLPQIGFADKPQHTGHPAAARDPSTATRHSQGREDGPRSSSISPHRSGSPSPQQRTATTSPAPTTTNRALSTWLVARQGWRRWRRRR